MSYGSVYLESYTTQPVVVPNQPASAIIINLEVLKITCENWDTSPTLAAGDRKCDFRVPPFNAHYIVFQRVQSNW